MSTTMKTILAALNKNTGVKFGIFGFEAEDQQLVLAHGQFAPMIILDTMFDDTVQSIVFTHVDGGYLFGKITGGYRPTIVERYFWNEDGATFTLYMTHEGPQHFTSEPAETIKMPQLLINILASTYGAAESWVSANRRIMIDGQERPVVLNAVLAAAAIGELDHIGTVGKLLEAANTFALPGQQEPFIADQQFLNLTDRQPASTRTDAHTDPAGHVLGGKCGATPLDEGVLRAQNHELI